MIEPVIAAIAAELPPEVVTSGAIEARLAPLYDRIGLVPGRLELMTGIKERRFWREPVRPSDVAARAGARAIAASGIDRGKIGLLIHGSVCRDFLEPATASVIHHHLELPSTAQAFDLSNACLGVLSGVVTAMSAIEAGRIDAALIVSGEDGRPLVEQTIAGLLADPGATRQSIKRAFASLTIGAGAAAILVSRRELAPRGHRLAGFVQRTASQHHGLCQGGEGGEMTMSTDAEALLAAGLEVAKEAWQALISELSWPPGSFDRVVTHQVGRAHTRALHQAIGVPEERGFVTYDRLGNVGSASLPLTLALAEPSLVPGQRVGLLGIGSGLQTLMIGVEW